jgi:hypothetical protein
MLLFSIEVIVRDAVLVVSYQWSKFFVLFALLCIHFLPISDLVLLLLDGMPTRREITITIFFFVVDCILCLILYRSENVLLHVHFVSRIYSVNECNGHIMVEDLLAKQISLVNIFQGNFSLSFSGPFPNRL